MPLDFAFGVADVRQVGAGDGVGLVDHGLLAFQCGGRVGQLRGGDGQFGAGRGQGRLVVAVVDARQHVAGLHGLVVVHLDAADEAGHLRCDYGEIRIDVGVGGALVAPVAQQQPAAGRQGQHAQHKAGVEGCLVEAHGGVLAGEGQATARGGWTRVAHGSSGRQPRATSATSQYRSAEVSACTWACRRAGRSALAGSHGWLPRWSTSAVEWRWRRDCPTASSTPPANTAEKPLTGLNQAEA
ncbi:hypothetical protein G6F40_014022 [Rhizopus arrhizus]|nr:hypothetical protein G6F40_014022 [Rhizopus arrhizus]